MTQQPLLAADDTPRISVHRSRHLLSTFFIATWTVFIVITIAIHEIAHGAAFDYQLFLYSYYDSAPWVYRHGKGLPGLLRTAFAQAHAPVTAMHLTRLTVNMLEASWVLPKTWMEVFWLADRRWAGPFGLGKTGWTIISRRMRVSFGFIFLAALNIVALVTPIFMTKAYSVATEDVFDRSVENVSMVDLPALARLSPRTQVATGNEIWTKGLSSALLFPLNTYIAPDNGVFERFFFTGELPSEGESSLTGVFVQGNCLSSFVESISQENCYVELPDGSYVEPVSSWNFDGQ